MVFALVVAVTMLLSSAFYDSDMAVIPGFLMQI
jgi:hypothetical protein